MKKKHLITAALTLCFSFLSGCSQTPVENNPGEEKIQTQNEQKKEEKKQENIFYVKPTQLNVRESYSTQSPIVYKLSKFDKVENIDNNSYVEENDQQTKWYNIKFVNDNNEEKTGWVSSEFLTQNKQDLLSDNLNGVDLSNYPKTYEYENNKRQKVKGIYVTINSIVGNNLDRLIKLCNESEINAFVVDVKDDYGHMLFKTDASEKFAPKANEKAVSKEKMSELIKKLNENNIYLIARIVTFKDPIYTEYYPERAIINKETASTFVSKDGLRWASAHDRKLWEYDVSVAKEAAQIGFNEIQFDYVRFPASNGGKLDSKLDYRNNDGDTSKAQTVQSFLKYAKENISPENVYVSADIFGLVGSVPNDMGLGQYWEAVSGVVDYVCPMMYPSHYGNSVYGIDIHDAHPYETVFQSAKDSVKRNTRVDNPATIRPWIQDFTASWVKGHIKYDEPQVREQIKALNDNGIDEYILWNAGNRYSFEQ
ncbi:putative glycoside hydrolase [Tepidibacter hydrothermalis]|uniref:Glycoside hydrolase n=1 Tax=Tepidibacter hydrothermalis TaxID=3036126 RepID=A0ABY8EC03_9FIRM|nr:putative glycoside hydrolase [Tepidibacter hydrothermalis]WFD10448.1 putative glycoside hydrolase [Tepidibacter hydrothermalis]